MPESEYCLVLVQKNRPESKKKLSGRGKHQIFYSFLTKSYFNTKHFIK